MALTHEESFLQAIREHPDDDTPRLVYADWLEEHGDPARAEFVRVQVALAGMAADPRRVPLAAREQALLAGHRDDWLGPLRDLAAGAAQVGHEWEFRRGFLERVALDARVFLERAEEVFAWAPVRDVHLRSADEVVEDLAASPWLGRLDCLDLRGDHIGAAGMEALAGSPHLGRLRTLDLHGNVIGSAGARALARAPWLVNLTTLLLPGNEVGAPGAEALAGSPNVARLTALDVASNNLTPAGIETLRARCPQVRADDQFRPGEDGYLMYGDME